jgi:hypothetical protein
MGLLDSFDDPGLLAALSIMNAGRAQPQRQSLAGGLLAGMQAGQQAKDAQSEKAMRKQQFDLQQQQGLLGLQQLKQQMDEHAAMQAWRNSIPGPQAQPLPAGPYQGAAADSQAANVPQPTGVDPNAAFMFQAMKAGAISPLQYHQALQKDNTPFVLKDGELAYGRGANGLPDFTKVLGGAQKNDQPASVKEYLYAKMQGYDKPFEDWSREQANLKAPKTTVSVNTGQKGFDNTLKLRGDFRSEPIYKAHQEMQSAQSQIQQSLKAGSAIGDTAAATKIMKLLDPGSVVRESELGMALAATGLADKVGNFAQAILTGQRLNPQQRKDFAALADTLYAESVKQYNAKRGEYEGIAQRNQLNVPDVVGTASAMPAAPTGQWSMKLKGQ